MKRYIILEYQYRDASNYKAQGRLLLEGIFTEDKVAELTSCLDGHEFFIPECVGVPALQSELYKYAGPNDDDHQYHEFCGIRTPNEDELKAMEIWGTVDKLLFSMKAARARWLP